MVKKGMIIVLPLLTGIIVGRIVGKKGLNSMIRKAQKMSDKHLSLFLMMNQWVEVKQEGKNLASFFEARGYRSIAIYGMSYVGETLLKELKDTNVKVVYGIDRNANILSTDIDILSLDDKLETVDAVVVTAITYFGEIYQQLSEKIRCPILSLEDILYEV